MVQAASAVLVAQSQERLIARIMADDCYLIWGKRLGMERQVKSGRAASQFGITVCIWVVMLMVNSGVSDAAKLECVITKRFFHNENNAPTTRQLNERFIVDTDQGWIANETTYKKTVPSDYVDGDIVMVISRATGRYEHYEAGIAKQTKSFRIRDPAFVTINHCGQCELLGKP
jgi:hypothetical protein